MQQIIRTITQQLLNKIRDEQLHYTPKELENYGFPPFLVRRIALELERNLAESVTLPDSDWADMQTDPVQDAWDNFLRAIRAETRIPASYLRSVVENAVEDILDLMAEPEQMVLDTLFRTDDQASLAELEQRRAWVVVNRHLADAIIRYMGKRELSDITRGKAFGIVRQVDQHLSASFTPLKWAQGLGHWFELMGESVPARMLVRYFNDLGMPEMAKRFEQSDEMMGKARLIEILSKPVLEWADPENETIAPAPEAFAPEVSASQVVTPHIVAPQKVSPQIVEPEVSASQIPFEPDTNTYFEDFDEPEVSASQIPFEPDTNTYFEDFDEPESVLPVIAAEDSPAESETTSDILDDLSPVEPSILGQFETSSHETSQTTSIPGDSDIPIWQRFADPETLNPEPEATSAELETADLDEETPDFDDEIPRFETTSYAFEPETPASDPEENVIYLSDEAKILLSYLSESKDAFIEALFRNDEAMFYSSMNELVQYHDWATAGRYITRDIFARNRVDLYSEQAISYLDAVQLYFEENT